MKDICRQDDDGALPLLMHDVDATCVGEEGMKAWAAEIMEAARVRDSFPGMISVWLQCCAVVVLE